MFTNVYFNIHLYTHYYYINTDNKIMPTTSANKMKKEENNIDYNKEDDESLNNTNFVPIKKEDANNNNIQPKLEYNNLTALSYRKNGLEIPDNLDGQQRNFLSKVSVNEKLGHKIKRTVTKIVRLKAPAYSNTDKLERKEFLYYFENWNGTDFLGRKIAPVTDHIEGFYQESEMEPIINQQGEKTGDKRSGQHTVYYIPFSKEKVDEIVESSVGTDKDTIKYLFTDGALGYEFPYEEFVSRPYEELVSMLIAPGGPKTILQKQQLEKYQKEQQQVAEMLTSTSTNKQKQ